MRSIVLLSAIGLLAACANSSTDAGRSVDSPAFNRVAETPAPDPVLQWNRELLKIVRTPGAQPSTIHPTRSFAMLHAAIYDAVNSIDRQHEPYAVFLPDVSRRASKEAAAAAAAHDVLAELYPAFRSEFDEQLRQSLAEIEDGPHKREGVAVGENVAARLLALRVGDGSSVVPPPFTFGSAPGDYQSTPPNFPAHPQFTHWSRVTPFVIERANEFRPGPPPALTSDRYEDAFNEVKSLGRANGTAATPDQALTGRFWNGAIQNYWNEIAQTVSADRRLTIVENARLFALLDLALADVVIAFYDAKYSYELWRPVTAIRAAAIDGNPNTSADSTWLPLVGNTTPDPSYPGAHAAISAAALAVLRRVLGTDRMSLTVTSEILPGTQRTFSNLSDAAREATLSRIFAGVHFRFDLTAGEQLGTQIGDLVSRRLPSKRW